MCNKNQTATILIVDDQEKNLLSLEAIFQNENYRLIKALSAKEALKYLLEEDIALLLLDVQMPVMDGFQLAQMIRNRKKTSEIPIMFLSAAYTNDEHLLKGYQFDAIDYILKPFNPIILKSKVKVLVEFYHQKVQLKKLITKLQHEIDSRVQTETLILQQKNELIKTHEELKNASNYNQHLFDNAPIAYIVLNGEGFILECNKKMEQFLCIEKEEIKNQYITSYITPEFSQDFNDKWKLLIENKKSVTIESQMLKKNNKHFWCRIDLEWTKNININEMNEMILGTVLDTTEQRLAEEKLRIKQAQLVHAGRLVSLGEMSTGVAHELNQPLSIIQLSIEGLNLIANKKPDSKILIEKFKKESKSIIEEVDRASEIINNMRAYARSDDDNINTNLIHCIDRSLSFFKERFRQHDIHFKLKIDENVPSLMFNPRKFEQIVVNLLSNANYAVNHKYEQIKKGKIQVNNDYDKMIEMSLQYEQDREMIIFSVSDNGIGMTDQEKNKCLDPFYTTKEIGQGTGLGLSIIHGIINDFHAEIDIKSTKNKGTIITICIPFKKENYE